MSAPERLDAARAYLSKRSKRALRHDTVWDVVRNFHLRHADAEKLLNGELLRRGMIRLSDLTPAQRRAVIDPANLDLHAIAAGPIMDANEIFLPAGRISIEEAKAREAAGVSAVALCGVCDRRAEDPQVERCDQPNCPMRAKEAA